MRKLSRICLMLFFLTFIFQNSFCADAYIYSNSNWSTAIWYDAPTGGNIIPLPTNADNIFTNGYVLTVDGNYECNNITVTSNTTDAITVSNPNALTIYGKLTGPGWVGNDLIGGDGTIRFVASSGTILENWANSSTFENIVFDPGSGNTVNFATSGAVWCWVSETGKATIASGTLILNGAGHNVALGSKTIETGTIEVAEGATLEIQNNASVGSPDGGNSDAYRMGDLIVNGTLVFSSNNNLNVTDFYIGETGHFENTKTRFYSIPPDYYVCEGTSNFGSTKYIQENCSWSTAVWYDAPSGGNIASAPTVADTVNTNGFVLTVDGDQACNSVIVSGNTVGAITVADPNSLAIHGILVGPVVWANGDLIGGDGTIIFRKTSGTILENWKMSSIFENIIFDPGVGNTVNFATSGMVWCWISETGKATIASGTLVLDGGGHNVVLGSKPKETGTIEIAEGATLEVRNNASIGSPEGGTSDAYRMGDFNIYGTFIHTSNNQINTTNIYVGENGIFNTTKAEFFSVEPDLFIVDGTAIGVNEFFIDHFIQNKTYTTEETINGNKIWAGENVTETQTSGSVVIDNGANVTIDAASHIILDKGFQTKSGGTLYAK